MEPLISKMHSDLRNELCVLLDVAHDFVPDARRLAEATGEFTNAEIDRLWKGPGGGGKPTPTADILDKLKNADDVNKRSIRYLIDKLTEIKRSNCAEILKDAYPSLGIKRSHLIKESGNPVPTEQNSSDEVDNPDPSGEVEGLETDV